MSLDTVLAALSNVRRTSATQHMARCPAHEDSHASLSVGEGADGRVLIKCQAGCSHMQIVESAGLRLGDLFPPREPRNAGPVSPGRIAATYDYTDAAGNLLYQVVRFVPKDFRQRRPDGQGGWTWSMGDQVRVPYRLRQLANTHGLVVVCEGEKDADAVVGLGFESTCNPGGAGKWHKMADDSVLDGRPIVIIADKDEAGREHARDVAALRHGKSASVAIIEVTGPHKDAAAWITAGGTADQLRAMLDGATPYQPNEAAPDTPRVTTLPPATRPQVMLGADESRVIEETIAAWGAADTETFQRSRQLVRIVRDEYPKSTVHRQRGTPVISATPASALRERVSRYIDFRKMDAYGDEQPAHPPAWLVTGIHERCLWPGVRPLTMVSDTPILRADGSILQQAGYDADTGVLYEPAKAFPNVCSTPTQDDAAVALLEIEDVISDFTFETPEHKSAWLAGLLTPLARTAFTGPAPLFLVDANVRGAGKTLLTQIIGMIVAGVEMPVSSYTEDTDELRKRITSIALAGDRMVLLDNLAGNFGNAILDGVLTTGQWNDRVLGRSEMQNLPLNATWYATGNNVQVAADTLRRCLHIRLDVKSENPEHRGGFKHPFLLDHVTRQRDKLLTAALTILSAFIKSGDHVLDLKPFGSFEGWGDIVRQAIVWLGWPDPCKSTDTLAEAADVTGDMLSALIAAWRAYDPMDGRHTVSEMMIHLYPSERTYRPADQSAVAMRAAFELLTNVPSNREPTPKAVGAALSRFRGRYREGYCIERMGRSTSGHIWQAKRLEPTASPSLGGE